ncbi:MAG: hypothetical protein U0894_10710 [Pirellulales bacterium]
MRESKTRLGVGMCGLYLAAGAFYIPLMTLSAIPPNVAALAFPRLGAKWGYAGDRCGVFAFAGADQAI